MHPSFRKDLIVLAADKDMRFTLNGLLSRPESLDIKEIEYDVITGLAHDPDVLLNNHTYLRNFQNTHKYALVILDKRGCGIHDLSRIELEGQIELLLSDNGWGDRCAAIVIEPELEAWVWSDSSEVDVILGWKDKQPDLRSWLVTNGFCKSRNDKPDKPKEAMTAALKIANRPISSANFEKLSLKVSLRRCDDSAFLKFKGIMKKWFSINNSNL